MADEQKAKEPFRFYTRLNLSELTGLRASTLPQLLKLMKEVPGSSIYHHTHRYLQQHRYYSPEPPNDFAYWISEVLGEDQLGERLVSIDLMQYGNIHDLRLKIVEEIEAYMQENPTAKLKFARPDEEFHFIKSISFIMPTKYIVYDLNEFADVLEKITMDSVYFHMFEARLRLEKATNDFANWVDTSVGDKYLANKMSGIDPYTYTLEDLRKTMVEMIRKRIKS